MSLTPATIRADGERVHKLKTWPEFYEKVRTNEKRHEMRKDDRDFRVGDLLELVEWDPTPLAPNDQLTGRSLMRRITYLMRDFAGITPGYCLMSIAPPAAVAQGGAG